MIQPNLKTPTILWVSFPGHRLELRTPVILAPMAPSLLRIRDTVKKTIRSN